MALAYNASAPTLYDVAEDVARTMSDGLGLATGYRRAWDRIEATLRYFGTSGFHAGVGRSMLLLELAAACMSRAACRLAIHSETPPLTGTATATAAEA